MRLRVPRDGCTCPFLEEGGCSIHPAKPAQCRVFPFWPELVESRREWLKTARYCPGIGKGPLIQIEQAREQAKTPLGQYWAVRYEAFLFNGAFYARKGRLFIWVTEDEP